MVHYWSAALGASTVPILQGDAGVNSGLGARAGERRCACCACAPIIAEDVDAEGAADMSDRTSPGLVAVVAARRGLAAARPTNTTAFCEESPIQDVSLGVAGPRRGAEQIHHVRRRHL